MINVLINAYAISPIWGSEQGVGWHWMTEIAKHCRVFVITEGEWRDEIEAAIELLPQKDNIKMFYNPVSDRVRRMCWNQGDYRFYFHYARWQKKTLEIARRIVSENHIDIIHQLNMVGFREPGLLWKIKGIPYVWGPLGGAHSTHTAFLNGFVAKFLYELKNLINKLQLKYSYKVRKAVNRADILITPLREDSKSIMDIYGRQTLVMSETGIDGECISIDAKVRLDQNFNILWVGRFIPSKKLDLALQSIAAMKNKSNVVLHIVGSGAPALEERYKLLAQSLDVASNCRWYGRIDNETVKQMMRTMDLLFFSSIHELTSTVVPEAVQNRLPVLCHDAMGFGSVIEDGKTGFKIPLVDPKESIEGFAAVLDRCKEHIGILDDMKRNFDATAEKISYQKKGEIMLDLYETLLQH